MYNSRWLHIKTNNIYKVKCEAIVEKTLEICIVYSREDGTPGMWIRPKAEFLDGRFKRLEDRKSCGCTYDEVCICDDPGFK